MKNKISILAILENTSLIHNLLAIHGQSLLLDYFGNRYLFDVSESFIALKYNLDKMEINIDKLKAIIISHKHSDHSGALPELIKLLEGQKLYVLPDQLIPAKRENILKDLHDKFTLILGENKTKVIKTYKHLVVVNKSLELEKDLYLTGPLGEEIKEQAVVINLHKKGIVILTGCSHPTLPVIVKKAQEITGNKKVYGIIGGFHFKSLKSHQLRPIISYFKKLNPKFIVPSHCTGYQAVVELKRSLKDKVVISKTGSLGVGSSIEILPKLKFGLF